MHRTGSHPSGGIHPVWQDVCFFLCGGPPDSEKLHAVSMLELGNRVRECAKKLNDFGPLALLSGSVLVAQEAKYHARCLKVKDYQMCTVEKTYKTSVLY